MTEKRKGARSTKDIPVPILQQLNEGKIETANLVEWLAVDQRVLLANILTQNNRTHYLQSVLDEVDQLKKQTVNTINEAIGSRLFLLTSEHKDTSFTTSLMQHSSDVVRCWATYFIGKNQQLSIEEKLEAIKHFAADGHFGVREICWMAVRKDMAVHLEKSIEILSFWVTDENPNVRRFASESIRPRGVWCDHIDALKQHPELALPILEPLKSDTSKYVQDSVGNWLNDASKTRPDFVKAICERWEKESGAKETSYIIRKALRTLNKQ